MCPARLAVAVAVVVAAFDPADEAVPGPTSAADEVRRRTGDDADRIDDPPVEDPTPAAATVVGDIMRSA